MKVFNHQSGEPKRCPICMSGKHITHTNLNGSESGECDALFECSRCLTIVGFYDSETGEFCDSYSGGALIALGYSLRVLLLFIIVGWSIYELFSYFK